MKLRNKLMLISQNLLLSRDSFAHSFFSRALSLSLACSLAIKDFLFPARGSNIDEYVKTTEP